MSDKVLRVWWRYLTYFLSYREYSRGGAESAPPPSGARVKVSLDSVTNTDFTTGPNDYSEDPAYLAVRRKRPSVRLHSLDMIRHSTRLDSTSDMAAVAPATCHSRTQEHPSQGRNARGGSSGVDRHNGAHTLSQNCFLVFPSFSSSTVENKAQHSYSQVVVRRTRWTIGAADVMQFSFSNITVNIQEIFIVNGYRISKNQ